MYLVVITRKRNVGSLLGHAVWKAADFDVISYKKTVLHLSEIQVGKNGSLIPKEIQTCCGKKTFMEKREKLIKKHTLYARVQQTFSMFCVSFVVFFFGACSLAPCESNPHTRLVAQPVLLSP